MFSTSPVLTQADGYGIIIGFGALFAVGMVAITYCLKRYQGEHDRFQRRILHGEPSRENRSDRVGGCLIMDMGGYSLQSSSVAYLYGVSGPFWYASGATVQIILFCFVTNILVTSMLLTGGSAVVHSLTGMHIAAACFLLPLGTIIYTMFGGIKAKFLTDYAHTVVVLIIILFFTFVTYTESPILGSPSKVYE